jgi:hypothetical protein
MQKHEAQRLLEAAVMSARACQSAVVLIRPITFVDVLRACPTLIQWCKDRNERFAPTYEAADGTAWPLEINTDLYPVRRMKSRSVFSRDLVAVPAREAIRA